MRGVRAVWRAPAAGLHVCFPVFVRLRPLLVPKLAIHTTLGGVTKIALTRSAGPAIALGCMRGEEREQREAGSLAPPSLVRLRIAGRLDFCLLLLAPVRWHSLDASGLN